MTIKELKAIAKENSISYVFLKSIYDHLMVTLKEVDSDTLLGQIRIIQSKGIKNFQSYLDYLESIKKAAHTTTPKKEVANIKPIDKGLKQQPHVRRKLGYSRQQWRVIEKLEAKMKPNLENLITIYMTESLTNPTKVESKEDLKNSEIFKGLEERWKIWAKSNVINVYPNAKTDTNLRTNILNALFNHLSKVLGLNKEVAQV